MWRTATRSPAISKVLQPNTQPHRHTVIAHPRSREVERVGEVVAVLPQLRIGRPSKPLPLLPRPGHLALSRLHQSPLPLLPEWRRPHLLPFGTGRRALSTAALPGSQAHRPRRHHGGAQHAPPLHHHPGSLARLIGQWMATGMVMVLGQAATSPRVPVQASRIPSWSQWSAWSGCSCYSRRRARRRFCKVYEPQILGFCVGRVLDEDDCEPTTDQCRLPASNWDDEIRRQWTI